MNRITICGRSNYRARILTMVYWVNAKYFVDSKIGFRCMSNTKNLNLKRIK